MVCCAFMLADGSHRMSRRRLPPLPPLLAVIVTLALVAWLALGDMQHFQDAPPEGEPAAEPTPPRVEVSERRAEAHSPQLVLQGHLTADRELTLRARQPGRVEAGTVVLALARDELPARLEQAEAELTLARAELAGADDLRRRQLLSNTDYLRLQSSAARAAAEVASLRRQLDDTRPTAPFDGVLERLDVELGELVQAGETFGQLVDDRHLVARAWVPQRDAHELEAGLPAELHLLDGARLEGEVSLVGRRAEDETRSFPVEARVANPEGRRLAGASATLVVTLSRRQVQRLSPALLELDDDGRLAVKHLDDEDRVVRTAVTLVDSSQEEARVAGLPERVRLITLGGGLVAPGERVTPVAAKPTEESP